MRNINGSANTICHKKRYDDLLEEENEAVQIALQRLSPKEAYERVYRIRRSVQCSTIHKLLPKDQWTKPEEVRKLMCLPLQQTPLLFLFLHISSSEICKLRGFEGSILTLAF
jgi:hypothetical protein